MGILSDCFQSVVVGFLQHCMRYLSTTFLQGEILLGPFDLFHFKFILDTDPVPISRTSFRFLRRVCIWSCVNSVVKNVSAISLRPLSVLCA